MPVILVPVHLREQRDVPPPPMQRAICLRPFITRDFMTGRPAIPGTEDMPLEVQFLLLSFVYQLQFRSGSRGDG